MSWSKGGGCLQLIERIGPTPYRVSVVERHRRARQVTLLVTVEGPAVDAATVDTMVARLRLILGLDRDLEPFYALCRDHPTLRSLPDIGGGRLIRSASLAENILKTLCSTNVNWTQAVKMINRLAQLGPYVPHFRHLNAWPTPSEILRAGRDYLVDVCRLGYRADSILEFCTAIRAGRLDTECLDRDIADPSVPTDDLVSRLQAIRGIGPASANALLTITGRYDRLVIDSATVAHVAAVHNGGRKPSTAQIRSIYEPYGRWKNLVCWCENWITWDTARTLMRQAPR